MPTTLPRYTISGLPRVKNALSVAQAAWPDEASPVQLIYRLLDAGAEHLREDPEIELEDRRAALRRVAKVVPFPIDDGQAWLRSMRDEEDV